MGRAKRTIVAVAFTLVSCTAPVLPAATPISRVVTLRVYATTAAAPLLHDLTTAYHQQHPEIVFELATGSFQSMADRILTDEDAYFFSHHLPNDIDSPDSRYWAAPLGQDAIVIVVHPDNPIGGLSVSDVRRLYEGRRPGWDLPDFDPPLRVITGSDGSGLRAEFEALIMGGSPTMPGAQIAPNSQAMAELVAREPGAIGYVSLSQIGTGLRVVPINGVLPSADTVYDRTYPLRTLLYVVGRAEPLDDAQAMRAFIGWIQSPEGQAVVGRRYAPLLRP
jgi:phosphate transport system substrate-binding protein